MCSFKRWSLTLAGLLLMVACLWIGAQWILSPFTPHEGWAAVWGDVRAGQMGRFSSRFTSQPLTPQGRLQISIGLTVVGIGVTAGTLGLLTIWPRRIRPGQTRVVQGARWADRRDFERKGML